MKTFNDLADAIQIYIGTAEAKRRNPRKLAHARVQLDRALIAHRVALVAPSPVSSSQDPAVVPCPICAAAHDTRGYVTGCSVYCYVCSAWLVVSHQVNGTTRLTHLG